MRTALGLLRAASAAPPPTAYFKGIGVKTPPAALTLLSAGETEKYGLNHPGSPAMVGAIIGPNGVQGAIVTTLNRNATEEIDDPEPNQILDELDRGYVIVSALPEGDQPVPRLIVATSIVTAASVAEITGQPTIAAIRSSNLATISPPECSEVIICPDNVKADIRAAEDLADRLHHFDLKIRIATPETKGDTWNDGLFAAGSDAEQRQYLCDSILRAKRFEPSRVIRALPATDFVKLPFPEPDMWLRPWLSTSSLAMIHAERGGAKTWLALAIAHAVATGRSLMDWPNERRGKVLYIDGELPGELIQSRLKNFGGAESDLSNLQILSPDLLHRRKQRMPDLGTFDGRNHIDEIIERGKIDLIIVDSLSTLIRSGADDATSWMPLQDWALHHRGNGRAIIFVHHDNKKGQARGPSKREDTLDTIIHLMPQPATSPDGMTVDLEFTKSRRFFGADAAPRRLSLSTSSGTVQWTRLPPEPTQYDLVMALKAKSMRNAEIAKTLNLSPGRITQIISEGKPAN